MIFNETCREFNGNLRAKKIGQQWHLQRKIFLWWFGIKDDRGIDRYTAVDQAVMALFRISKRIKPLVR